MKAIGFAGYSGAGKTTLAEQVVRLLIAHGQSVSVIKHAHASFDVDRPGKDSYRHREAGAYEVMLASPKRMALLREWQLEKTPPIEALLRQMQPVDWVLVEGFKHAPIHKIEVWREENNAPLQCMHDPFIIAVATDAPHKVQGERQMQLLDINEPEQIVNYLMTHQRRFELQGLVAA